MVLLSDRVLETQKVWFGPGGGSGSSALLVWLAGCSWKCDTGGIRFLLVVVRCRSAPPTVPGLTSAAASGSGDGAARAIGARAVPHRLGTGADLCHAPSLRSRTFVGPCAPRQRQRAWRHAVPPFAGCQISIAAGTGFGQGQRQQHAAQLSLT